MPLARRLALLATILAALVPASASASTGGEIVVFEARTDRAAATETAEREDALGFDAEHRFRRALRGFSADLTPEQADALRADPEVAAVVPNRRVHALAATPAAPGETVPPGVRRIGAATATTVRQAADGAVAVIDTGIDLDHPDLNAQAGKNCVDAAGSADDDNGHGTHVAGTIGARNQGNGVVGVAPGTKVLAVKVLDANGEGYLADVICGIEWVTANAAAHGIKALNLSLGGPGDPITTCGDPNDPLHGAVCAAAAAGVTPVAAAGNDAYDFDYPAEPDLPGAYPEVLAVSAMEDTDGLAGGTGAACDTGDDRYASFSNFAATAAGAAHLVAAPGVCIRSTWPGGGTRVSSGTSMAAPHVAALVALCHGEAGTPGPCAGLTPPEVIAKLRADAATRTGGGFAGDLASQISGRIYGPLAWFAVGFAPTVDTPAATVEDTAATISTTVRPGGRETTWRVEYGPTSAYGTSTAAETIPAASAGGARTVRIEGLAPGSTVHARVVAVNEVGTTPSAGITFTVPAGVASRPEAEAGTSAEATSADTAGGETPPATPAATPTGTVTAAGAPGLSFTARRLGRLLERGLGARLRCTASCRAVVRLRVSRADQRRLGLASSTLATARVTRAGRLTLRMTRQARRKLRRQRRIRATLAADVQVNGRTVRVRRTLTIRR